MKKIEGIKEVRYNKYINGAIMEGAISIISSDTIKSIVETVNELVEAHNQEVLQPEENLSWGDTELKFEKCDKNLLESIFGEDKRDEEDKKLDQRIIESHEDNTEEWKEKFREIDSAYDRGVRGGTGRGEVDWQLEDIYIEFIEQLLSERSFSKEELEKLLIWQSWYVSECGTYDEDNLIREKVDRLLSLEK